MAHTTAIVTRKKYTTSQRDLALSFVTLGLRRALEAIPQAQADAVLYCDVLGFSERETATILGESRDLIHWRRTTALSALKGLVA